jgi:glycosyltransferase involved in cell wall biosynthesis
VAPIGSCRFEMNPTRPLSLIIATFNRGPKIAATLDSVLRQTIPPDEVVVVDDCSTDGTGAWVQAHYPEVRVVRTERNVFTAAARNWGAEAAAGRTLMFLDHDDVLETDAVQVLLALREAFPEAGAVYADHRYVNRTTGVCHADHHTSQPAFARLRRVPILRETSRGRLYGRALYRALLHGNLLQQPWAIDAELFRKLGGYAEDIRYCEDWELYLRVTRAGPVAVTDQIISDHIVEGENLHLSPQQAEMHRQVIERCLRYERFRHPSAAWVLHRRLAGYLKMAGDEAAPRDLGRAWRCYLRSFWHWPFDHVVGARLLLWPLKGLGFKRRSNLVSR